MKGFTLIELLAVIVILALILVIAVPQINKTITDSQKKSFESDAKIILSQIDIKLLYIFKKFNLFFFFIFIMSSYKYFLF